MVGEERIEKGVNKALKDFLGDDEEEQLSSRRPVKQDFAGIGMDEDDDDTDEMVIPEMDADFKPVLSSVSPQQRIEQFGIKPKSGEVDGKILTVAAIEFTTPKLKELVDGTYEPVPPKLTLKAKAKYYDGKIKIKFAENNYCEYIPGIKFWVRNNKVEPIPSIDRDGNNKVSQLFRLIVAHKAKKEGINFPLVQTTVNERLTIVPSPNIYDAYKAYEKKLSDSDIISYLVEKKVRMKDSSGSMDGNPWTRADIVEIVD